MRKTVMAIVPMVALLFGITAPAAADWCVLLSGPDVGFPFASQTLFVRFRGPMPKKPGKIYPLSGRIDGGDGEPLFGTATVDKSGGQIKVGATFFLDAEQGQLWMAMDAPFTSGVFGYGYGDYQSYGTGGSSGEGTVVDCATEPN